MAEIYSAVKTALTIAGSDPSGGAGIQADLKAFAGSGVYGLSVLAALTAQNSLGVHQTWPLTGEQLRAQLAALIADYPIHAIKTGMLASADAVNALADLLPSCPLVIDPVMRASLGSELLSSAGLSAARTRLWPKATLLTPNIPEAEVILGVSIHSVNDMLRSAQAFFDFDVPAVLLKGGHLLRAMGGQSDECNDLLLIKDAAGPIWLNSKRMAKKTHGTGCVYSALIAARLALGLPLVQACQSAHAALQKALARAQPIGQLQRASPDLFSADYIKADYDPARC